MFLSPAVTVSRATQTRLFSSATFLLRQKSLVDKIRAAPGSRNDLTFRQSLAFYWQWLSTPTNTLLRKYEDAVLKTVTLPPGVSLQRSIVAGLHEFHISSTSTRPITTPTLLVHGHAASALFYHRNFPQLSTSIQDLYAIDLPDTGLSDKRPLKISKIRQELTLKKDDEDRLHFELKQDRQKNCEKVKRVEEYYTDAIEQWRQEHNFDKVNIVAHSFGALMSFHYALRYPHRVNKLLLCSPAGVERNLFSVNNDIDSGLISDDPSSSRYYRPAFVPRIVSALGFTITKALGPFGCQLISKYLSMRYSRGSTHDEQVKLLVKYTIALFHQKSNAYKNLRVILNNQILAHDPILDHSRELTVPVHLMYGQYDWMNSQAGYQFAKEVEKEGKCPVSFSIVRNAGHNVFLDNHEEFDRQVIRFLATEEL